MQPGPEMNRLVYLQLAAQLFKQLHHCITRILFGPEILVTYQEKLFHIRLVNPAKHIEVSRQAISPD